MSDPLDLDELNELENLIADLMRRHGPDGHIDGHEIIAEKVSEWFQARPTPQAATPDPGFTDDYADVVKNWDGTIESLLNVLMWVHAGDGLVPLIENTIFRAALERIRDGQDLDRTKQRSIAGAALQARADNTSTQQEQ